VRGADVANDIYGEAFCTRVMSGPLLFRPVMNHVMFVFEQAGVAVAAISGLAAENKRVDLFGVVGLI